MIGINPEVTSFDRKSPGSGFRSLSQVLGMFEPPQVFNSLEGVVT